MSDGDAREQFRGLLVELFVDNTEEEAFALWRRKVDNHPQRARESLAVLDAIVAEPPSDLVELMEHDGWIHLLHRPDEDTLTPYSYDEHVEWLRDLAARFRAAYEAHAAAQPPT